MASLTQFLILLFPLLATSYIAVFAFENPAPFSCLENIRTCTASLYHISHNFKLEDTAFYYSVDSSQIKPIMHGKKQDYLITVPCSCKNNNDISGYFYDTTYKVKNGDTFENISNHVYSGQAWPVNGRLDPDQNLTIQIPCGCSEDKSQSVITYTVQPNDTPAAISLLLNTTVPAMQTMNKALAQNPDLIVIGWVLYVPLELNGVPPPPSGKEKKHMLPIIIGILAGLTLLSIIISFTLLILRGKRAHQISKEDSTIVSKRSIANRNISLQTSNIYKEYMGGSLQCNFGNKQSYYSNTQFFSIRRQKEKDYFFMANTGADVMQLESERPVTYSLEEIEEATNNFDEACRIGIGGYGSVYFGMVGQKEIAVKKMRSNKTKEFFTELKALCKIHHINIVELLGYASGEDYLYLVYEYVPNGSLSDHLHDPLQKGYQSLSWNARVQIALDAAKGLEYIHDHTKARYVHRDIKTSNILIDEKLRAKVADFGLAKLVDRTNDENFLATRLVGTPGYLPPEAVKELQVTPKTDVFAFGVVLLELITGKRALFRDSQERSTKMKSLISVVHKIFQDAEPETALEDVIDMNLESSYPMEDAYKMAEIARWCLQEEAVERPEMRDIVGALSQIVMSSIEWEASLGGNSQVFSGLLDGR